MAIKLHFRCPRCGGMNRVPSDRLRSSPICGRCGEVLDVSGAPVDLPDGVLDGLLARGTLPLLLAFVADGSASCAQLEPALARAGAHFPGQVLFVRVNAARNAAKHEQFGIVAVPQLYLLMDQQIVARKRGVRTSDELRRWLERHVQPY